MMFRTALCGVCGDCTEFALDCRFSLQEQAQFLFADKFCLIGCLSPRITSILCCLIRSNPLANIQQNRASGRACLTVYEPVRRMRTVERRNGRGDVVRAK